MFKRLFGKTPVRCWIVKQIDDRVLHLCGRGQLETQMKSREAARALADGDYRGGVRFDGTGIVLNSRLFAALVPLESLTLDEDGTALWQGRRWAVSRVPQRCWSWEGRLVAEPVAEGPPRLASSEDVSGIREHVDASRPTPGPVEFRAGDALEDPRYDMRRRRRTTPEDA
ncbi:hypothetical protein [Halomonas koreensis]|uniref:Uncharacterized protein n=1 Tax=Halomonas koreensis TaxID=245385 RepID=A0ABU1G456_9GAMM|nr:hypothetical protein [Halomonas koreensis]MDR5867466.1 hypothetical protein [Halomonas koreensis]